MTDSRVASLAALLHELVERQQGEHLDPAQPDEQGRCTVCLKRAEWLIARGVTVCTRCGEGLLCVEHDRGSRLGGPSPEPIDLLATAVGALADVDVVHLTETWTDREGCFYGGIPEWRASLLGHLRERFAALGPDGFGVRAGSEEAP